MASNGASSALSNLISSTKKRISFNSHTRLVAFFTVLILLGIVGTNAVFAQTTSISQDQVNSVLQTMTNLGLNSTIQGIGIDFQCGNNEESAPDYIHCKTVIGTIKDLRLGGQVTSLKVSIWTNAALSASDFQAYYNSSANPTPNAIFYGGTPQVEKFDVGSGIQAFDTYDSGGSAENLVRLGTTEYEAGLAQGEFQCGVITGYIEERLIIPQSFVDLHNNSNETDTQRGQAYYAERMQLRADAAPIAKDWLTKTAQALSSSNLCNGAPAQSNVLYGKIIDKLGRPLRDVKVSFWWSNDTLTDPESPNIVQKGNTTYTDDNGVYRIQSTSIAVPMTGTGYIRVDLTDGNNWIKVTDGVHFVPAWTYLPENFFTITSTKDLQQNFSINSTSNTAAIATIYVDTYNALGFYRDKLGFTNFIQTLEVWPFSSDTGAAFHPSDQSPKITIGRAKTMIIGTNDMNKEYHEFGHYMTQLVFGGQGYFVYNDTNHQGFINPDSKDSWIEGLAEFLGQVTYNYYTPDPAKFNPTPTSYYSKYHLQPYSDGYAVDLGVIEPINRTELDNQNHKVYTPSSEELAIGSILWSLYSPNDAADGSKTQLKIEDIWNIITGSYEFPSDTLPESRHIENLSDLYEVLTNSNIVSKYGLDKPEIDHIFLVYNVLTIDKNGNKIIGTANPSGGPLPTSPVRPDRRDFPIPPESAVLVNSDPSILPYDLTVNTIYDPPYDSHNDAIVVPITQAQQKVHIWLPTSTIYKAKAVLTGSKGGGQETIVTIDNTYYDTHIGASENLVMTPTVTLQPGSGNNQYVGAQSQTTIHVPAAPQTTPSVTTPQTTTQIPSTPASAQSFAQIPYVVKGFLSGNSLTITNQNTNSQLANYVTMQTVSDKYAQKVLGISGQYVTTLAFEDRYGRAESNNNLNTFLQISHTNDKINSMRGVELGGDSIMTGLPGVSSGSTSLVNSAEITIPQGTAQNIQQKVRDTLNAAIEPKEIPQPVLDFLNNHIDLVNKITNDHLTHYILVQTVPDLYAQKVLGISGQYVTTLAFEDRYGREDSNGNLNVFLQISHTANQVNSIRGIQLGGDDIEAFVNGVDEGAITKTVEITMSSSVATPPSPQLGSSTTPSESIPSQNQPPPSTPRSQSANGFFTMDKFAYTANGNPNDMATISGKLSDASGGTVVFTITKPDGTIEPINAGVTSVGDFRTLIIIDESFPVGTYTISGNYHGKDLGSVTFTVK